MMQDWIKLAALRVSLILFRYSWYSASACKGLWGKLQASATRKK